MSRLPFILRETLNLAVILAFIWLEIVIMAAIAPERLS